MSIMPTSEIDLVKIPTLPGRFTTYPQGPYTTGCTDLMIGKDKDGTLLRLYYPATHHNIQNNSTKEWTRWFLGEKYSEGLALFNMPHLVSFYTKVANWMQRDALIPAIWEAELATGKFPLVIFSHGLQANRSLYSCICNELASHGFIVAAIEHRDESACATFTLNVDGTKNWILINTQFSSENEFKIRKQQIEIRAKECSKALDIFEKLNSGILMTNELDTKFKLETLKGKLDLTNSILAGQSFGGGTVILTLSKDKRFKIGISLDPWMFPLKDQAKNLAETIEKPILFVLLEEFQDAMNMEQIKYFQNEKNEVHTIRKGIHQHQVDTAMLFSRDYIILQKVIDCYTSAIKPEISLTINNVLIMKFIYTNLNIRAEHIKSCEKFLDKYANHITSDVQGTARSMVGWITLLENNRRWPWSYFKS